MTFGTETTHQYSISEDSKEGSSQIMKQVHTVEIMDRRKNSEEQNNSISNE